LESGAQDLFGYAADEVIGKSILSLLPTERQAEEPNILVRVGRGERVQRYETVRLCKDGRCVAVSLSNTIV
jgi:PAS domain S-box-containing protein